MFSFILTFTFLVYFILLLLTLSHSIIIYSSTFLLIVVFFFYSYLSLYYYYSYLFIVLFFSSPDSPPFVQLLWHFFSPQLLSYCDFLFIFRFTNILYLSINCVILFCVSWFSTFRSSCRHFALPGVFAVIYFMHTTSFRASFPDARPPGNVTQAPGKGVLRGHETGEGCPSCLLPRHLLLFRFLFLSLVQFVCFRLLLHRFLSLYSFSCCCFNCFSSLIFSSSSFGSFLLFVCLLHLPSFFPLSFLFQLLLLFFSSSVFSSTSYLSSFFVCLLPLPFSLFPLSEFFLLFILLLSPFIFLILLFLILLPSSSFLSVCFLFLLLCFLFR